MTYLRVKCRRRPSKTTSIGLALLVYLRNIFWWDPQERWFILQNPFQKTSSPPHRYLLPISFLVGLDIAGTIVAVEVWLKVLWPATIKIARASSSPDRETILPFAYRICDLLFRHLGHHDKNHDKNLDFDICFPLIFLFPYPLVLRVQLLIWQIHFFSSHAATIPSFCDHRGFGSRSWFGLIQMMPFRRNPD